jgi:SEC-C motif domain protein
MAGRAPSGPCPCHSRRSYKRCCLRFHQGQATPTSPEALMRSRYAAYALAKVDYVIATTDPAGPQFRSDREVWAAEIREFCEATRFVGLRIRANETREADSGPESGMVEFEAKLLRAGRDVSLIERSEFVHVDGRWLYHDGVVTQPAG